MDLMEYKAKELFVKYDIPSSTGTVIDNNSDLEKIKDQIQYPVVIKAQVATGGRGKAGGVKIAKNSSEFLNFANQILGLNIKGHIVKKVMLTTVCDIASELYLAITLDRKNKCPVLIYSKCGGMDIEEVAKNNSEMIQKFLINPIIGMPDYIGTYIAKDCSLTKTQTAELNEITKKLYRLYRDYDCLLCEINPFTVLTDGSFIALDGKITIDDSALYRLPDMMEYYKADDRDERITEAEKYNFLYIPYKNEGDIAIISNGSGMIMSCIDRITEYKMNVISSLDLGGGSTMDRIKEGIRIIFSNEKVKYLFINIFGGITRCDEVANGVKIAIKDFNIKKPIVLRFEGTNKDEALNIVKDIENVKFVNGLIEGVEVLYNEHFNR